MICKSEKERLREHRAQSLRWSQGHRTDFRPTMWRTLQRECWSEEVLESQRKIWGTEMTRGSFWRKLGP